MKTLPQRILRVVVELEVDGRWIADVVGLPGVLVYASDPADAVRRAEALALRVLADRHDKPAHLPHIMFVLPDEL